jgi:hypothetical protein
MKQTIDSPTHIGRPFATLCRGGSSYGVQQDSTVDDCVWHCSLSQVAAAKNTLIPMVNIVQASGWPAGINVPSIVIDEALGGGIKNY